MSDAVEEKLNRFFARYQALKFAKGEAILRPEDNPPGVFYLKKGYVRLYSVSLDGEEITFNIFKPGSYFSMMWALGDQPNPYFFEAMTEAEVWAAPKKGVLAFLQKNPDALLELTKRILSGLSGLLWVTEHLLFNSAEGRVASAILVSAKRFGLQNGQGEVVIQLPLTHQNLASLTGLTRETTSLEIEKLEKAGLIAHSKKLLVVKNLEKLEAKIETESQPVLPPAAL